MKVLIIEDNFEIANIYRKVLEESNIVSDVALTGEDGKAKLKFTKYDLLLLDINLPDMLGSDILKEIKEKKDTLPIIVITAQKEDDLLIDSLNLGADDYLQKPINYQELVARINAVHRRYMQRNTNNLIVDNLEVDFNKSLVFIDKKEVKLTNKEFLIVIKLLEKYPGYATNEELINSIYDEYYIESSALRVHIYNLKRKLKGYDIIVENDKNKGYKLCFLH